MTVKTWLESSVVDEKTKEELRAVTNEEELEDRFSGLLEFGTGGLRGIIGAGTRRMNIYTVRHATQALADLINSKNIEGAKVVIAHDSRNFSRESQKKRHVFSLQTASTFIFSMNFAPRPSFLLQLQTSVVSQVSTLPLPTIRKNTTATRYTGMTALSFPPKMRMLFSHR